MGNSLLREVFSGTRSKLLLCWLNKLTNRMKRTKAGPPTNVFFFFHLSFIFWFLGLFKANAHRTVLLSYSGKGLGRMTVICICATFFVSTGNHPCGLVGAVRGLMCGMPKQCRESTEFVISRQNSGTTKTQFLFYIVPVRGGGRWEELGFNYPVVPAVRCI